MKRSTERTLTTHVGSLIRPPELQDILRAKNRGETVDEADIACLANDSGHFSADIKAALAFAELFASDYTAIGDAEFAELKRHFSTEAIIELNMFCALMLAGGRMTYVLRGYEDEL